jgi:hypothetical protein
VIHLARTEDIKTACMLHCRPALALLLLLQLLLPLLLLALQQLLTR